MSRPVYDRFVQAMFWLAVMFGGFWFYRDDVLAAVRAWQGVSLPILFWRYFQFSYPFLVCLWYLRFFVYPRREREFGIAFESSDIDEDFGRRIIVFLRLAEFVMPFLGYIFAVFTVSEILAAVGIPRPFAAGLSLGWPMLLLPLVLLVSRFLERR